VGATPAWYNQVRMRRRLWPALASLTMLGAAAWPGLRANLHDDSFPLSTYPMFATPRPTQLSLDYALVLTVDGRRLPVPPRLVGSAEVLQARATIAAAVGAGPGPRAALCAQIAARVAHSPAHAGAHAVVLVSGRHDVIALVTTGARGSEVERVRCPVPGGAP